VLFDALPSPHAALPQELLVWSEPTIFIVPPPSSSRGKTTKTPLISVSKNAVPALQARPWRLGSVFSDHVVLARARVARLGRSVSSAFRVCFACSATACQACTDKDAIVVGLAHDPIQQSAVKDRYENNNSIPIRFLSMFAFRLLKRCF
jgi:hypothetical protein